MPPVARSIVLIAVFAPVTAWLGTDLWRAVKSGVFKARQVPYYDNPRNIIRRDEQPINYWLCIALGTVALGTAALLMLIGLFFLFV